MERIHKKSALAETNSLLLSAHESGAELLWGRYEQQLPLCGFTGNGLNCRKCFQGPCRISPFGDEPSRGVCGADRDQIVMENLFQTTLEGVMESARALQLLGVTAPDQELPDIGVGLSSAVVRRLANAGLLPVRKTDLFSVQNSFFSHKGYLTKTLLDLTRVGLIHYGFLSQAASSFGRAREASASTPDGLNLLLVGQTPDGLVRALEAEAKGRLGGKGINLFGQGAYRFSSLLAACDHGSSELALGMNVDALVVAPNASWPGLEGLAVKYGIPVVLADPGRPFGAIASETVSKAAHHSQTAFYGTASQRIQPGTAEGVHVLPRAQDLAQALRSGRITGVVVIFGEPHAKQTFFDRTLTLVEAALSERALVFLGGDLGSHAAALGDEVRRRSGGKSDAFAAALGEERLRPISAFGSAFELPGVVSLLESYADDDGRRALPAVVCFPEFYRAATWASAVSLFALGFTVQIGIRLPFWGSPWVAETMKAEWHQITEGTLLAGPVLPEPSAQAEELSACLTAGNGR